MRSIKILTLIFSFTAILLTTFFLINTGTSSKKLDKQDSLSSKVSEPNIESLSKRYYEIKILTINYFMELNIIWSYHKNDIKNGRIEIKLPKKIQSIFGIDIEEINHNQRYKINNGRANFSLSSSIATLNMTMDQKIILKIGTIFIL